MIICIVKYFVQLSGIRSLTTIQPENKLMITGIHKFVRHPLYGGTFVFIWGLLLLYRHLSLLVVNTIITIYTLLGIAFEEKKLEQQFGDDYKNYKATVPKLFPKIKAFQ